MATSAKRRAISQKYTASAKGKANTRRYKDSPKGKATEAAGFQRRNRTKGRSVKGWLTQRLRSTKIKLGRKIWPNDLDIDFLLSLYEKQEGKCAVTGIKMTTKDRDILAASIDRINSDVGYLKDNVILVCRWVNIGRGKYCPLEQFSEMLSNLPMTFPVRQH
jgi:hypothetical protein